MMLLSFSLLMPISSDAAATTTHNAGLARISSTVQLAQISSDGQAALADFL